MLNELDNAANAYRASDAFADDAATDWQDMTECRPLISEYVKLFWQDYNGIDGLGARMDAIAADLDGYRDDFISDNAPLTSDGDLADWWLEDLLEVDAVLEAATMESVQ